MTFHISLILPFERVWPMNLWDWYVVDKIVSYSSERCNLLRVVGNLLVVFSELRGWFKLLHT